MSFVQDVTPELASSRYGTATTSEAAAAAGTMTAKTSGSGARKSSRARSISKAMRRVDAATRAEVAAARLDSFESDVAIVPGQDGDGGVDSDDEEFVFNENARDGEATMVKGKKKGTRTTRGAAEHKRAAAARTFNALLEQSFIDRAPKGTPTYLTAAAGPSKASAPRKFCSVCGFAAPYGCARCGMRFCSKKCSAVHAETRCLKMVG
ncbi:Zinc finger, HIT-type [Ostreococcus tauri]|uniref:Zinc finger, HIT-type n=2 Tax=Ostreococcus tauri TaxID=70448 RepID=A0A090M5T7_OSTTA|nr:Zinc finger, HIT-type [Ostreococcus tauri]CEF98037.1 Zinc finger, HIT-type [Ostreococcus tauri]|eukprot:XP_022839040.1 Zinc finger, HIT-type [Ostreococcus tauri]